MLHFLEALPHLANMISKEDARSTEEGNVATENAISAVAKILKYNSSMVDVNAVRFVVIYLTFITRI